MLAAGVKPPRQTTADKHGRNGTGKPGRAEGEQKQAARPGRPPAGGAVAVAPRGSGPDAPQCPGRAQLAGLGGPGGIITP